MRITRGVPDAPPLRRGWTTGACATAGAKAAAVALLNGDFPDPVAITLPRGERVAFALAEARLEAEAATAGVVKDAGDDPDVTHGALIRVTVRRAPAGAGVRFCAGAGVGIVTRPGLPIPPGEPAINPVPRAMIRAALAEAGLPDAEVTVAIPGGETIAERTLNGRLGIVGGLSILGTTGIVVPYSCAAWIAGIHQGIDVARAAGLAHVAGATGRTSEAAVRALHALPEIALIDMGDFVGGMLKRLRTHPVPRVTIAGGIAKMTKLAQRLLDLHSRRGEVSLETLAQIAREGGAAPDVVAAIARANTALHAFALAEGVALGDAVAARAWRVAADVLADAPIALEVVLFDRAGNVAGRAPFAPVHGRNRRR
jgi:cobalt-precorrin-5B (C1)-methyltransferase